MRNFVSVLLDFDQTCFLTYEAGPRGIGVVEAYYSAVLSIFGSEGLRILQNQGGLRNRSPILVVQEICEQSPELLEKAREVAQKFRGELDDLVPTGLGGCLHNWGNHPLKAATELLVRLRLRQMLPQIGERMADGQLWPPPCPGFCQFWRWLPEWSERTGVGVTTTILSAGHHQFIEKAFQVHDLRQPGLVISDDDIRALPESINQAACCKPSPFTYYVAKAKWRRQGNHDAANPRQSIYFGDDPDKDGGLAKTAGLPFGHFQRESSNPAAPSDGRDSQARLVFSHWHSVTRWLEAQTKKLADGVPVADLLEAHRQAGFTADAQ